MKAKLDSGKIVEYRAYCSLSAEFTPQAKKAGYEYLGIGKIRSRYKYLAKEKYKFFK